MPTARVAELRVLLATEGRPLSLRQLAARMGVDYSTLSLWERGKVVPKDETKRIVLANLGGIFAPGWVFPNPPTEGAA